MDGTENNELTNHTQPEEIEARPQPEAEASAPTAAAEPSPEETSMEEASMEEALQAEAAQAEAMPEMSDMESMSDLYEESLRRVQEGEVVKGHIVSITKDFVMVDIGYKSEGQIPIHEFTTPEGEITASLLDVTEFHGRE